MDSIDISLPRDFGGRTDSIIDMNVAKRWLSIADKGSLMHSYLVSGKTEKGRIDFITKFVSRVIYRYDRSRSIDTLERMIIEGNYADFHFFDPAGVRNFKVEQIANLQSLISKAPVEKGYKFFVINRADRMNSEAQNRLLKTLEEPPGMSMIFLLTERSDDLKTTIRSRCSNIQLGENVLLEKDEEISELLEFLRSNKFFYKGKEALRKYGKNRDDAEELLDRIEDELRRRLYGGEFSHNLLREINAVEEARQAIRQNMYVDYGYGVFLLKFGGIDD